MATEQDLRFRIQVSGGELRRLNADLRATVAELQNIGPAGQKGSVQAAAGLQRVQKAAGDVARARVASAAVTRRAALQELAALQQIARTSKKGSAEQIEANRLAATSARRLGLVQLEASNRAAAGWRRDELALNRLTRGALAGSGIFSRFGRAIAFGSLGFLGGATIIDQLRRTAESTDEADRADKAFKTTLDAAGISATRYGARIQNVIDAQSDFAAVNDTKVEKSLTTLVRATGELTQAERLNAVALDVAAAKHIEVTLVANALGKAYNNQAGALSRLVGGLPKGISGIEAIRIVQQRFAGQAEAAASRSGAAFDRFGNVIDRIRIRFGRGFLPFITRDLNEFARKLDDPETLAAAQKFGDRIGHDVGDALHDVVDFTRDNWPEIRRDFQDAGDALRTAATATQDLADGLHQVASIVPGKNSLIRLLLEAALLKKFVFKGGGGKAGAAAAGGGLEAGLLETAGVAAGGAVVASQGGRVIRLSRTLTADGTRLGRIGRVALPLTILDLSLRLNSQVDSGRGRSRAFNFAHDINPRTGEQGFLGSAVRHGLGLFGVGFAGGTDNAKAQPQGLGLGRIIDATRQVTDDAAAHFGERITNAAQDAAANTKDAFKAAFKEVEQRALEAFDARTSRILDAFDESTRRMEEKLRVTVRVAGEVFTIGKDEKTPAERELDALDKLQSKRNFQREIFDANKSRIEAEQIGDPTLIRNAERAQQDAQAARRRFGLEGQAERERKAADAALKAGEERLRRQREIERRDLSERRKIERADLQRQLDAQRAAFEKGKTSAAQAQRAIIATLRQHGVSYEEAGRDLGQAFAKAFAGALNRLAVKGGAADRAGRNLAKRLGESIAQELKKVTAVLDDILGHGTGSGKKRPKRFDVFGGGGFDAGGVVEGPAGKDVILSRLTRGEIVFADPEQQRLKEMLGFKGNAEGLFRHVRGFARGGVVGSGSDPPVGNGGFARLLRELEQLLRQSLLRQGRETQADARLLGTSGGHLSDAQRRALDPVHIESLVEHSAGRNLPLQQKLELESRLAQEQAHPVRSGLIRPTPTGTKPGRGRPLPPNAAGIPAGVFAGGGGDIIITGPVTIVARDPTEFTSKLRRKAKGNSHEWARAGTRRVGDEIDGRRATDTRLGV